MPNVVKQKHHLTQTEKDRAVFLTSQGIEPLEIGRELGVDARQISGFIRSQINMGKIPAPPSRTLPPSLEMPMSSQPPEPQQSFPSQASQFQGSPAPAFAPTPAHSAAPQNALPPAYQPVQDHAPQSDGWVDGRAVFGHSDGFTNKAQQVRTVVEREIPADGILGEHSGSITPTQICEIYGEGVYKILRYEPGRSVPMEHKVRASAAYGPARTPKRSSSPEAARPGGFQRTWGGWRGQAQGTDEEGHPPQRPYSPFSRSDPGLESFARHSSSMGDAATTEAIKLMGRSQEQMIEQISRSRENGPENFMKELLQSQTASMDAKLADETRRREQERKDEESRWERRQTELDKAHQRELERIKADSESRAKAAADERKMLMDIEERKLQNMREEHKNREEAFREELKRNRDELKETLGRTEKEIKETREAMGAQISESDERFQKRFEEHQAALEREHQLKEKNLETAEKFQTQVFELKREAIQSAGGDQLFQTINTVIKEFSKGLEKIVDLKKIEALTPEAQAAAVAKGTIDGNVMGGGDSRRQAQEQVPAAHNPSAAAPGARPAASTPADAAGETRTKEQEMEQVIRDNLDRPIAREIIKEWANQVKRENNPATFANTYMEWMRDPIDHEGRKATTMFANFMAGHDWAEILAIMAPKLDKETVATFRSAFAEDYYNGFRGMVTEQIRQYWEDFLTERQTKRAAASAAGDQVPAASDVSQGVKG